MENMESQPKQEPQETPQQRRDRLHGNIYRNAINRRLHSAENSVQELNRQGRLSTPHHQWLLGMDACISNLYGTYGDSFTASQYDEWLIKTRNLLGQNKEHYPENSDLARSLLTELYKAGRIRKGEEIKPYDPDTDPDRDYKWGFMIMGGFRDIMSAVNEEKGKVEWDEKPPLR
jgi:hypothetical protein